MKRVPIPHRLVVAIVVLGLAACARGSQRPVERDSGASKIDQDADIDGGGSNRDDAASASGADGTSNSGTGGDTAERGTGGSKSASSNGSGGSRGSGGARGSGTGGRAASGGSNSSGGGNATGGSSQLSSSGGNSHSAPDGQWVLGYYPGYEIADQPGKIQIADIDWSGLSHIIFASIKVNADFSLALDFYVGNEDQGRAAAMQVADAASAHNVTPMLMLGGSGVKNISGAIAKDVGQFADRLLSAMDDLHYKGIDLDVEDDSTLAQVASLAKSLREKRDSIVLTYPGPTMQFAETTVKPELIEIAGYLDRLGMQTYYGGSSGLFTGGDSNGNHFQSWFPSALSGASALTPYAIDDAMKKLADAGIPKQKLAMGMGGNADCYLIPATTPPNGMDVSAPGMPTNAPSDWCWNCGTGGGDGKFSLSELFAGDGTYAKASPSERKRDSVAKVPYLSLDKAVSESHCGGSTRFISFEDETSIRDKGAFSKQNGYGGIIIWTISQLWLPDNAAEGRSRNALFQALKAGFLDP